MIYGQSTGRANGTRRVMFWLFAVLSLGLVLLVFLMKRSVAEKGELIGGE